MACGKRCGTVSNDNKNVRFFDSHNNKLFDIPDGENIIVTHFDGGQEILPCRFIDDTHIKVGETVFLPQQFAELQERLGSVYAPEHPRCDDTCDTYTIYQILNLKDVLDISGSLSMSRITCIGRVSSWAVLGITACCRGYIQDAHRRIVWRK